MSALTTNLKGITVNDATEAIEATTELEAVGMDEIPSEVLTALVATGREFFVTRSVTYTVGYMDVQDVSDETGHDHEGGCP